MSDKLEALKAAAEKYSATLKAHQENPKDFDALVAWDTATSEITSLINNDEISIITSLLAALESQTQSGFTPEALAQEERAETAEQQIAELNVKLFEQSILLDAAISRAEAAEQRLQQTALADVIAERQRQIDAEGWTPQHDDEHTGGEIADAAACYARLGAGWSVWGVLRWWPWDKDWLKPAEPRRSLVKAGALILAEIERLDRAAAKVEGE